jgi:hypothetical protein
LRIYNRLVLTIALVFGVINVFLAFLKQNNIEIYFIANTIAFLIVTLLYTYFNPRARSALNNLSLVIFAGFLVIVAIKVIEILQKN